MKNAGIFLGGLITGAALGASLGLLFAPQKGTDTRDQLLDRLKELDTELKDLSEKVKDKGLELKDDMRTRIGELEGKIESLIDEYKKKFEPIHNAN